MHFDEAVQYLLSLGNEVSTMKLGLRTSELLFESLHNPERSFPAVQIAGTNGKGSVTAILDSICRSAGIKTGRYTSPHLTSITERITINGQVISEEKFARYATRVRESAEALVTSRVLEALPTFFEHVTAIALMAFHEAEVDLAILETGLGGRLDSTTAAHARLVAITQIALDHQQYLGNTLREIAAEKAAIIRRGMEAVVGPQSPEAWEVIAAQCVANEVIPAHDNWRVEEIATSNDGRYCVTIHTEYDTYERLQLGLRGQHQIENTVIAIQLAESLRKLGFSIARQAIIAGVQAARHPGRLELFSSNPPVLLDGAHNPAGAQALRNYLEQFASRPLVLIFGAMVDKQLEQMATVLFPVANKLVLTPVNNSRSASTDLLRSIATKMGSDSKITIATSSLQALDIAKSQSEQGLICVAGSLYLIGEVRPTLLRESSPEVVQSSYSS
ncbi:MAG: bifunctional folylpolyglutamate synthase/dihydrofolate synthase [Blastocatellia bacterium]|nr:MAG: bifunctional folylpolyglutamate synthase/dihydrofolate synthase [Blastocatellia bacterium]